MEGSLHAVTPSPFSKGEDGKSQPLSLPILDFSQDQKEGTDKIYDSCENTDHESMQETPIGQ